MIAYRPDANAKEDQDILGFLCGCVELELLRCK